MVSQKLRGRYTRWSQTYDRTAQMWEYRTPAVLASRMRELLPTSSRILDCACGTGLNGPHYPGASLFGADATLAMTIHTRSRGYRSCVSDARALPYLDDTFDAVLCTAMLDQYRTIAPFVREMARVVRPDGLVAFTTFCDREERQHLPLRDIREVLVQSNMHLVETFRYASHHGVGCPTTFFRATIAQK